MRFYPFDVGHYRQDTGHLTMEEHYAYRQLLDECYFTEKPLPQDKRMLMRKLRLTPGQEWVLDNILLDFFVSTDGGYINPRVEAEIAEYYRISKQARDAANTRWARVKAAKEAARGNGADDADAMRTQCGSDADAMPIQEVKNIRTKKDTTTTSKPAVSTAVDGKVPIKEIVEAWNVFAAMHHLPQVIKITKALTGQIRQRWIDIPSMKKWTNFFDYIGLNTFLSGRAQTSPGRTKPFRATLLWVTKETNFAKITAKEYD